MRLALVMLWTVARFVAAAPSESIVIATSDATFGSAVDQTLLSAGMTGVQVRDSWQPEVADLTGAARRLADREHATATIALVFGPEGSTLLTYDRSLDRVLLRSLPYRAPLSEAESAEAARMARAMLRALRVTPDVDLAPPHAVEAKAVRDRAAAAAIALDDVPSAMTVPSKILALDLGVGFRVGAVGATAYDAGSVGVVWRPDAPGLAVTGSLVPTAHVAADGLDAAISDSAIAITARIPLRFGRQVVVVGQAGAALHRVRVSGVAPNALVDRASYDPAIRAGLAAIFELQSGIGIGVAMTADGLLRHQEYTVNSVQVLDVPLAQLTISVSLLVRVL